jgi:hypothetical protein
MGTCRRAGDLVGFDRKRNSRLWFFSRLAPHSGAWRADRACLDTADSPVGANRLLPDMPGECGKTARLRPRDVAFPHRSALFEGAAARQPTIAKHLERQMKIPKSRTRIVG